MNLLYYCNEYPPAITGGIGVFTRELAEELVKQGHNVYVYGQYDIDSIILENINGVKVYRDLRRSGTLGFIFNRIKAYFEIRKIIKNESIDIIEVQDFHGLMGFFPQLKCKTVVRLHGSVIYFKTLLKKLSLKDKVWFYFEKSNLNKSDIILSVSDFTANLTRDIFKLKQRIYTVHNGVKIKKEYLEHDLSKHITYIFAGSIIEKKGIVELINAWPIFSQGKDVSLHVYGKNIDGLTKTLKKYLKEMNVNNVIFHGAVHKDELLCAIEDADYCVFPTKAEAFSLAPMEAMSMSKVVMYTDQTSARELILHRYNGLLIKECSEKFIIETLNESYLLTNDEYLRISRNAYSTIIKNYNVADKVAENINIYETLLT